MRVALLTNIATPYRVPVYEALAATSGWKLRVFVSADSEFDRSWRLQPCSLDVERVPGLAFLGRNRTRGPVAIEQAVTRHLPLGLLQALRRFGPDVVVSNELGARTWLALLYCTILRVPLVMWSYHSRLSASVAGPVRRALWRLLLTRAQAVIGMGVQARQVLRRLGVPRDRIFDAPNAHDRDGLEQALAGVDAEARLTELAEELEGRKRIALVAGRLVGAKGIGPLLAAWNRLPESLRADWTLLFIGSGPLDTLIDEASVAQEEGEIVRVPAVQQSEVIPFYACSDLLVFASLGDNWGLVVNEAFACAVPALVSCFAGCADDLVEDGENGWVFDPTNGEEFTRALGSALSSPDLERMAKRARETAARFQPSVMTAGFRRAIRHAVPNAPRYRSPEAAPDSARD